MSRSSGSILAVIAVVLFGVVTTPAATGAPVRIPSGALPAEVAKLGDFTGLTAFAIADDGETAAAAFAAERPGRSVLRLSRGAGTGSSPVEVAIRGRIRSLRFSRDGADIYVVAARDAKRENGDAFLLRIAVATREVSREFVLPRGASDVDWIDASTLIVASPNELRTFAVPSLTSGPLYRLGGSNRALATVPGTRRLLVAGEDGVVLVDLDDPQSRDGLPAREKLPLATPVVALAIAPDGREALNRHEDGHVERFTVEPLGDAVADGQADAIAWPGPRADAPPPAPRPQAAANAPPEPEPVPRANASEPQLDAAVVVPPKPTPPSSPAPPEARATPPAPQKMNPPPTEPSSASPSAAESKAPQTPSAPTPQRPPPAVPPESPGPQAAPPPPVAPSHPESAPIPAPAPPAPQHESAPTLPPESSPPTTEPTPPPPPAPQPEATPAPEPAAPPKVDTAPETDASAADRVVLRGAVTGAAAANIAAVVILGPNNLLHEAARVKPSADGSWSVTDLAPGAYRIQLDAGSGRAVEAHPSFRTVKIESNGTTQVAPIEARRIL